jgi:hypothetical protein
MKTSTQENFRVVIEPRSLGDFGSVSMGDYMFCTDEADRQRQYRERCHAIAANVRRHVDNVGSASVMFDTVATCSHCGAAWTEDSDQYNGGCCDADEAANPEQERAA